MFIGVVIIQDRKALNAFYVLMSRDGGRDLAILSARQYFGNFYRMAVESFRPLLFFQYIWFWLLIEFFLWMMKNMTDHVVIHLESAEFLG